MNKKIYRVITLLTVCLFTAPVFAATATASLASYVRGQVSTTQLNYPDGTRVEQEPDEELNIPSAQQQEPPQKRETHFLSANQADLSDYVSTLGLETATGKLSTWEERRKNLYIYVQSSNWHTGKNISDADRAFAKTLETIAFGLIKELLHLWGCDLFLDRMEQHAINAYENNEQIQYAAQTVAADISDDFSSEEHTIDGLYINIQHNPFNLLTMNSTDFKKLITTYPEAEHLFNDLYVFFKWRYDLRQFDLAYKLNEDNINEKFRRVTRTNSFFAWWELSNIARNQIRKSVEAGKSRPTTFDVSDERDSMAFFKSFATRSLYFGRMWNGMQRYAVKRGILPDRLNPKRGAFKAQIKKAIAEDLGRLSDEDVLHVMKQIRHDYNLTRKVAEQEWEKWLNQQQGQLQAQDEAVKEILEERKASGEDPAAEKAEKEKEEQEKLAEAQKELISDIKEIFTQSQGNE